MGSDPPSPRTLPRHRAEPRGSSRSPRATGPNRGRGGHPPLLQLLFASSGSISFVLRMAQSIPAPRAGAAAGGTGQDWAGLPAHLPGRLLLRDGAGPSLGSGHRQQTPLRAPGPAVSLCTHPCRLHARGWRGRGGEGWLHPYGGEQQVGSTALGRGSPGSAQTGVSPLERDFLLRRLGGRRDGEKGLWKQEDALPVR